ncbi:MAG: hypothetical protein QOG43_1241 [Actinomycetota bacterium]|nr:hypothetical protein [Actinomycetota bacterium]
MTFQDSTGSWVGTFDAHVGSWRKALVTDRRPEQWVGLFGEAAALQEILLSSGAWQSGAQSLLGIIDQRHLEKVHSRVLSWLLDPNGRHGLGSRFLKKFLAVCDLPMDGADRHVGVVTEEACCHPEVIDRYGYTDVVVRGINWTLVIEDKLWAGQHGDQLDLYYDAYLSVGACFVYLTPEGVQPRSARPEVTAAFRTASWRHQVLPELRAAIQEAKADGERCFAANDYVIALEEELA